MRIGEIAAQAGVNAQTLRYYERRGLLGSPQRRPSGYREYLPDAVRVIRFVKRAQELGLRWLRSKSCCDSGRTGAPVVRRYAPRPTRRLRTSTKDFGSFAR